MKNPDTIFDRKGKIVLALLAGLIIVCCLPGCATTPNSGKAALFHQVILPSGETNTIVNPAVTSFLQGVKDVNGAVNPTPSAPLVNIGVSALGIILAGIAAAKNRKAKQNGQLAEVLIQGVELANSKEAKAAIDALSKKRGVADLVHSKVKQITKGNK